MKLRWRLQGERGQIMYNDKKMFDDLRLAIWMHKMSACKD